MQNRDLVIWDNSAAKDWHEDARRSSQEPTDAYPVGKVRVVYHGKSKDLYIKAGESTCWSKE